MSSELVQAPNCQDGTDPALHFDQALAIIRQQVRAAPGFEVTALRDALGRVLSQAVISPSNVPPHRNSAMDGYALAGSDLPTTDPREFPVVGTAWAGKPYAGALRAGQCVRIMTGAKLPDGADTVVIQEKVQITADQCIRIGPGHAAGQNVRHPGEDIELGREVLPAGKRIGPAELGLLASLGIGEVALRRRARVAFFTSGDELRSIGQPLREGDIYDSNRYTLYGMLSELGVDFLDMGVIPDRAEDLARALDSAAGAADLILTTGGISVGAADHIKRLMSERGTIAFSKIELKPGRPVTFGRWRDTYFFGLPGNPVAVMVTFYHFARPAIRLLQGEEPQRPPILRARSQGPLRKHPGRTEIQRGNLFTGNDGVLWVEPAGKQGSGILSSMSKGNCFILLEHERGSIAAGESVTVEPFPMLRFPV